MWKSNVSIHLSACLLPSTGEKPVCQIFIKFGMPVLYKDLSSEYKFRKQFQ